MEAVKMVNELKKQARERNIQQKIKGIARRLGTRHPKRHGCYWKYSHFEEDSSVKGPDMYISFDDFDAGNLIVTYMAGMVFSTQLGNILCYRPDIEGWEEIIDKLYKEHVQPHEAEIKAKREAERKKKLRENWGIQIA